MSDKLRLEQVQISRIIKQNSSVLDLGCGDGDFLHYLVSNKNIHGVGIELNQERLIKGLEKGLNVIQGNLDSGLNLFEPQSFDYVILNETLQVLQHPLLLLKDMLRVGRHCIVGINNFGYWKMRLSLLFKGRMPKTDFLPYEWYNTPNIHLCTLKDFEETCSQNSIKIVERIYMDMPSNVIASNEYNTEVGVLNGMLNNFYNLFACYGVYLIISEQS